MAGKYIRMSDELSEYMLRHHSHSKDPLLNRLRRETLELGEVSGMQIGEEQGTFLSILVAALGGTEAIEIGTFTGYSSFMYCQSPPGGRGTLLL